MLKLEGFKPKGNIERTFTFPEGSEAGFQVRLRYLSPQRIKEIEDAARDNGKVNGKRRADVIANGTYTEEMNIETVSLGIVKFTGVKFDHLRALCPLDPEVIAQNGGLDAEVPLDPSVDVKENAAAAAENILFIIRHSPAFYRWAERIVQNIAFFQSGDWNDRAKNSKSGQNSSTDAQ